MSDVINPIDLMDATIEGITVKHSASESIITMLCIELVDGRKIEMHAARGGELVIRRE